MAARGRPVNERVHAAHSPSGIRVSTPGTGSRRSRPCRRASPPLGRDLLQVGAGRCGRGRRGCSRRRAQGRGSGRGSCRGARRGPRRPRRGRPRRGIRRPERRRLGRCRRRVRRLTGAQGEPGLVPRRVAKRSLEGRSTGEHSQQRLRRALRRAGRPAIGRRSARTRRGRHGEPSSARPVTSRRARVVTHDHRRGGRPCGGEPQDRVHLGRRQCGPPRARAGLGTGR